jgi:CheY-like chemotaxis protein
MNSTQKKILIVDDDPDIVLALATMLEDAGYVVVTTDESGCLEHFHERDLPNMILLDMLLSGLDGREIARQLKGQSTTQHIPILMLSAHPSAEQEAKAAGAGDFLAKPFELDELLAKVAMYLAQDR